jgi:hypothetical protein
VSAGPLDQRHLVSGSQPSMAENESLGHCQFVQLVGESLRATSISAL